MTPSLEDQEIGTSAVFSDISIKYVYTSWDIIAGIPGGKKQFGDMLFHRLSDTPLSKWFDERDSYHMSSLIKMMDMLVHMLSPTELDIVADELYSLGKRHAQYNEDLIDMFRPSQFRHLAECFCQTLMLFVKSQQTKRRHSQFHETNNHEAIQEAWEDLLFYIRRQMEKGAQSEHLRKLAILKQQKQLASPEDRKEERGGLCKELSMRSLDLSPPLASNKAKISRHSNKSPLRHHRGAPKRAMFRFASFHGLSKTAGTRSPPVRTVSSSATAAAKKSRDHLVRAR